MIVTIQGASCLERVVSSMENIMEAAAAYRIHPTQVETITERVAKIEYQGKHYAIKKGNFKEGEVNLWKHVYDVAAEQRISAILPLYVTERKNRFIDKDSGMYYLSPWVESHNAKHRPQELFIALGELHEKTVITETIESEAFIGPYIRYQQTVEQLYHHLLAYMEQCETSWYMSPKELLICTQFHDVEKACQLLKRHLDAYALSINENQTWRYALCHGRLDQSHVLQSEQLFIINWDQAHYSNPMDDLIYYFNQQTKRFTAPIDELLEALDEYADIFSLLESELHYLSIHLLNPLPYLQTIQTIRGQEDATSMLGQVKQLQQLFRQMMFGMEVSKKAEQLAMQIFEANEES